MLGALRAADDLDERHAVDRVEEVHADDVLGMLRVRGDVGDRDRRRVRGEDRARLLDAFELREDLPLDVDVLDDGLDHEVGAPEAAPVGGGGDAGELPLHLPLRHPPRVDFAPPDLRRRLVAAGDGVPVDVAHAHVRVGLVGDDVGDPPAHHARPQHAGIGDVDGLGVVALVLRVFHHEEEADEVLGDFALDERHDFVDLAGQAALDAAGEAGLDDVEGLERRGVVAVGLREDGLAGLAEDHAAGDGIAADRGGSAGLG